MDLLHDMGQSDAFFVDGEALVLEACCFCRSSSQLLGGQPLSTAYYAERRLQQLLDRGGRFTVVFYRAMDAVWQQQPAAYALRQVLITHLCLTQQHLQDTTAAAGFDVRILEDFWGQEWQQYISGLKPKFVLVTDIFLDAFDGLRGASSSSASSEGKMSSGSSSRLCQHRW